MDDVESRDTWELLLEQEMEILAARASERALRRTLAQYSDEGKESPLRPQAEGACPRPFDAGYSLEDEVDELRENRISAAMEACKGNMLQAAKVLGIKRTTLQYRAKKKVRAHAA